MRWDNATDGQRRCGSNALGRCTAKKLHDGTSLGDRFRQFFSYSTTATRLKLKTKTENQKVKTKTRRDALFTLFVSHSEKTMPRATLSAAASVGRVVSCRVVSCCVRERPTRLWCCATQWMEVTPTLLRFLRFLAAIGVGFAKHIPRDGLIDSFIHSMVGWQVDWLADWLVDWLVDWFCFVRIVIGNGTERVRMPAREERIAEPPPGSVRMDESDGWVVQADKRIPH